MKIRWNLGDLRGQMGKLRSLLDCIDEVRVVFQVLFECEFKVCDEVSYVLRDLLVESLADDLKR